VSILQRIRIELVELIRSKQMPKKNAWWRRRRLALRSPALMTAPVSLSPSMQLQVYW